MARFVLRDWVAASHPLALGPSGLVGLMGDAVFAYSGLYPHPDGAYVLLRHESIGAWRVRVPLDELLRWFRPAV